MQISYKIEESLKLASYSSPVYLTVADGMVKLHQPSEGILYFSIKDYEKIRSKIDEMMKMYESVNK